MMVELMLNYLIKKFKNSRNAVIHYLKNNDIETENFKLITA